MNKSKFFLIVEIFFKVLVPCFIIIIVATYPFYERRKATYQPIQFLELLNNEIGNENYYIESTLDKGLFISQSVILRNGASINILKEYLTKNKWHYLGINSRQQEVFCLNSSNSIVFFHKDNKHFIAYLYRINKNEDCEEI